MKKFEITLRATIELSDDAELTSFTDEEGNKQNYIVYKEQLLSPTVEWMKFVSSAENKIKNPELDWESFGYTNIDDSLSEELSAFPNESYDIKQF